MSVQLVICPRLRSDSYGRSYDTYDGSYRRVRGSKPRSRSRGRTRQGAGPRSPARDRCGMLPERRGATTFANRGQPGRRTGILVGSDPKSQGSLRAADRRAVIRSTDACLPMDTVPTGARVGMTTFFQQFGLMLGRVDKAVFVAPIARGGALSRSVSTPTCSWS